MTTLEVLFNFFFRKNLKCIYWNQGNKVGNDDWFVVTDTSFNEQNAEILSIPKKSLLNYNCPSCKAEYLCNFNIGFGSHPERGNQEGRHNMLFINEIIQIGLDGDQTFLEVLEEHIISK